jgi:hypothetical protein
MTFARMAALFGLLCACRGESTAPTEPSTSPPPPEETAAPPAEAPTDWKAAFSHRVRYDAERHALVVEVEVADGFHVYTQGETIGKPMKLTLAPEGAFEVEGGVTYPEGVTKDLPIGRSVIVEGEAEVVAPLKPKDGESAAADVAKGRFRYQVCTDEACDRPRTESFEVEVGPRS